MSQIVDGIQGWHNRETIINHLKEEISDPFILSLDYEHIAFVHVFGDYIYKRMLIELKEDMYTIKNNCVQREEISTVPLTPRLWIMHLSEKIDEDEIIPSEKS